MPPPAGPPVLIARGLSRSWKGVPALQGLDVELKAGRVTGLLGPDGAGKTTALRLLAGLLRPDAGRITLDGNPLAGRRGAAAAIGYMPQRFSLYPDLSVDENLAFYARLFGVRGRVRRVRTEELLGFARLEPFRRRRAAALSGGMKQKLALACTLVHRPRVLLLDEPTTGVDPVARVEFWNIVERLCAEGAAVLVSTPYMDEAERCDRLTLLRQGQSLDEGTPDELRGRFPLQVFEVAVRPLARAARALEPVPGVIEVAPFGDRLHVTVAPGGPGAEAVRAHLQARGTAVQSIEPARPSMEDVFLYLARRP